MTTESAAGRKKVSITVKFSGVDALHARKTIKRTVGTTEEVGLWTRHLLEDSDNNWLMACARRHPAFRNKESDCCLLLVRCRIEAALSCNVYSYAFASTVFADAFSPC